jgi:hypothetical protein
MIGTKSSQTGAIEDDENEDLFPVLKRFFQISVNYLWIDRWCVVYLEISYLMLVADRKHINRNLSPCVYMTAMAVTDMLFLVGLAAWFMPVIYFTQIGHGISGNTNISR